MAEERVRKTGTLRLDAGAEFRVEVVRTTDNAELVVRRAFEASEPAHLSKEEFQSLLEALSPEGSRRPAVR